MLLCWPCKITPLYLITMIVCLFWNIHGLLLNVSCLLETKPVFWVCPVFNGSIFAGIHVYSRCTCVIFSAHFTYEINVFTTSTVCDYWGFFNQTMLSSCSELSLSVCVFEQVDFTSCTGLLCALCVVVLVTGIITSIVLSFHYVSETIMAKFTLSVIMNDFAV